MDRENNLPEAAIELGTASTETRGDIIGLQPDDLAGVRVEGMSDE